MIFSTPMLSLSLLYCILCASVSMLFFFFFNDTATTEIYTLSLHDALPIFTAIGGMRSGYARHQGETGQRQNGDTRGRVRTIDRDIGVAATRRKAEVLRTADVVRTSALCEAEATAEDAAIIRLAFIPERQRLVA